MTALDDTVSQIALMTGSADTVCRFRAVNTALPEGSRNKSVEIEGTWPEVRGRLLELNQAGYNIYIMAQPTRPVAARKFASDADVTAARCIYADDDTGGAFDKCFHVEPTFRLRHPTTGRGWAAWTVNGVELDRLPDWIKRLAMHYGTDDKISNPSRVIRLAGFDRWKDGKNYGPYVLEVISGHASDAWMHEGLPKLPPRAKVAATALDAEDVISAKRLRGLLAFIDPDDRDVWRNVIFAVRDAKVLNHKLERMGPDEVLMLLDEWASGELHNKHTGPKLKDCYVGEYQGYEDNEALFYGKRGAVS
jgi:hypothetical protein